MKFELKAEYELTKGLDKKLLDPLVAEANKTIMVKGAPKGKGAKISSSSSSGKTLSVSIESDTYVRAHDAALRLKKLIGEKLGREHHVGVRGLKIKQYKIQLDVAKAPSSPMKLPLTDSISFKGKTCTISFKDIDEAFLQKNYIDRVLKLVEEKIRARKRSMPGTRTRRWKWRAENG